MSNLIKVVKLRLLEELVCDNRYCDRPAKYCDSDFYGHKHLYCEECADKVADDMKKFGYFDEEKVDNE